jgi:hypothetical protein
VRRLFEEVIGGFVQKRLDISFEGVVSSAGIAEKCSARVRGEFKRRMKQPFDVEPVLRIHRTPAARPDANVQAAREGLPPG